MLANMATSLILHKKIATTTAKAKALRSYIEPLLTKSKEDSTHSRRMVFSYLKDKEAVATLFREVSPKIAERPGGYTRILKTGSRIGDNADMCILELVDFNEIMLAGEAGKAKATTRRRRSTKKKEESEVTSEVQPAKATAVKTAKTKTSAAKKNETPEEPPAEKAEEPKTEE